MVAAVLLARIQLPVRQAATPSFQASPQTVAVSEVPVNQPSRMVGLAVQAVAVAQMALVLLGQPIKDMKAATLTGHAEVAVAGPVALVKMARQVPLVMVVLA